MKKIFGPARSAWLLAFGIALSGVAQAGSIITESFSATISSGTDSDGLFGTAGNPLAGDTILMSFSYDPSQMYNESGPSADIYIAGAGTASASFKIGTVQQNYTNANGSDEAVLQPLFGPEGGAELTLAFFGTSYVDFNMYSSSPVWTPGDEASQSAMDAFIANQIPIEDTFYIGDDQFTIGSLTPGDSADAPEPASIVSLGLGLAFVAYIRRRAA